MRLRHALVLGLGLFGGLLSSCGPRQPPIRNVLLISIDTLRADHLGSYGFPRPTTPHIDALAREGVLFRNAYSPVPVTLPAHCSLLTGTLPPVHGVRDNLHERLPDASVTLAEMLKPRGFATAAVVSSFVLDRRFNLAQGFDSYDDRFQAVHKIGELSERKGDETTRLATQWLEARGSDPFFLFLHYYDPHDDYAAPEPFASRWADDGYSGEVAFTDHNVGQIVDKLKQRGLYDQTLIVVTGDHGEMLGEHGERNHGFFIYESALKVPLIFRVPKATPRQVQEAVSLIDVMPTIAALLGAPAPSQAQGRDLSPFLAGTAAAGDGRPLYAETITPTRYYGASSLLAVIADGWKYIETSRPELYDLRRDPGETNDLIAREPARAAAMSGGLKAILASRAAGTGEAAVLDAEARERLESLGYLDRGTGGGAIVFDRSKEDPKDLIGFFRLDQTLSELVEAQRYAEAKVLCDTMLRQRPGFADCHLQMSRIAAAEGDLKTAVAAASKAVELSPGKEPARRHLAGLLTQTGFDLAKQGRGPEAEKRYRQALALDPASGEAHAYLGAVLAARGDFEEAIVHFEEARRAKPDHAKLSEWLAAAHLNRGRALKQRGKLAEASEHYRRAIAIDPRLAAAHNSLGSVLGAQGRLAEAIQEFREALRLQPDSVEARNNLDLALRMSEQGGAR